MEDFTAAKADESTGEISVRTMVDMPHATGRQCELESVVLNTHVSSKSGIAVDRSACNSLPGAGSLLNAGLGRGLNCLRKSRVSALYHTEAHGGQHALGRRSGGALPSSWLWCAHNVLQRRKCGDGRAGSEWRGWKDGALSAAPKGTHRRPSWLERGGHDNGEGESGQRGNGLKEQ